MYILNQKINNLEEKSSVLENFSQSIFQFITQREEARLKQEETKQEPNQNIQSESNQNTVREVVYSNQSPSLAPINENKSESEDNEYNVTDTKSGEQISETFESKEILSEMVSELKDSLIKTTNENLENDLQQIQELKQELKEELKQEEKEKEEKEELFEVLNNADIENREENIDKKKEEELNKMSLADIKALAKIKNIPLVKSNKPKKKETLIQELLV
jgi:hypothetical protein